MTDVAPTTTSRPASIDRLAGVDWSAVGAEAFDWLRTYIRYETVNDPARLAESDAPWRSGREAEAAGWLAGILRAEGIQCELFESAPGRVNLLARLPGSAPSSSITLLSHSDVVPAVRADWSVEPFAATVRDGHLYGRGVLDLKGLGIAQLAALILLHRNGVPIRREIRLLVVADEETGGDFGAAWLLRERPDLRDTSLVLGEGGYSPTGLLPGGRALHAIAVAEKGYLELELSVEGTPHHAGVPDPDSAPARLVRALTRILDLPPSARMTPETTQLCACLAAGASWPHRYLLRHPSLLARFGVHATRLSPLVRAMFTDTCAVTLLSSGYKSNVVPGTARAVLSLRLLPGSNPDSLIARIRRVAHDPDLRIQQVMHKAPTGSPFDTADFALVTHHATAGGALATPMLSPGASDARHWRAAGVTAYGWVPFVISTDDIHGVHGADERMAVDAFHDGLRRYCGAIADLACTTGVNEE